MPKDESPDSRAELGEAVAAILRDILPSLHTPVSPELCAWLGKQIAAVINDRSIVESLSNRPAPTDAVHAGSTLDNVRGDVVSYLLRRRADLEHEIQDSDQAGPWDERDHLYDELDEVKGLLDRLQWKDDAG